MFYIVEFHADGGQMCSYGRRSFEGSREAERFAEKMRAQSGHTCGQESVRTFTSETNLGNEGYEYPMLANTARGTEGSVWFVS